MSDHAHRWVLDEPNGPVSTGRCGCGIERRLGNSLEAAEELKVRNYRGWNTVVSGWSGPGRGDYVVPGRGEARWGR